MSTSALCPDFANGFMETANAGGTTTRTIPKGTYWVTVVTEPVCLKNGAATVTVASAPRLPIGYCGYITTRQTEAWAFGSVGGTGIISWVPTGF